MKILIETDFEVGDKAISVLSQQVDGALKLTLKTVTVEDVNVRFKEGNTSVTYTVKDHSGKIYQDIESKTLFSKKDLNTVIKGCESALHTFINRELK